MSFSFILPRIKVIHISKFRIVAESKFGAYRGLAHYTPKGSCFGKTERSFFGEPNHYGREGVVLGYSRKANRWTLVHFGKNGKALGYSRRFLWVFWIHHGPAFDVFLQAAKSNTGRNNWKGGNVGHRTEERAVSSQIGTTKKKDKVS